MGKSDTKYKKKIGRGFTRAVLDEPLSLDDQQLVPWEEIGIEDTYIVWGEPMNPELAVWVTYDPGLGDWQAMGCNPKIAENWAIFPFMPDDKITRTYSTIPHGVCAGCDGPCPVSDYLCGGCRV